LKPELVGPPLDGKKKNTPPPPVSFLNEGVRDTVFCVMHYVDRAVFVAKKFTWSGNPSRAIRFTAFGFSPFKQISRA